MPLHLGRSHQMLMQRNNNRAFLYLPSALIALLAAAGCSRPPASSRPGAIQAPTAQKTGEADASPVAAQPVDAEQVQAAVSRTLQEHPSTFPKKVRLTSLVVRDRVAHLDFSAQFNGLSQMGDTTESHAQKLLRSTLAAYPGIDKMTITVEGKPFDSQMTDWSTPFPVRVTEDEKRAQEETDQSSDLPRSTHRRMPGGGR